MNFINNFKLAYSRNLIDDHIKNQNLKKLYDYFINLKSIKKQLEPANYLIQNYIEQNSLNNFFQNKIAWINSFDLDDTKYINQFIQFYFKKLNIQFSEPNPYHEELAKIGANINLKNNSILFNDLLTKSYLFQFLITLSHNNKINFINSNSAFFQYNNLYFTHFHITSSYIYVIRNPVDIFYKYINIFDDHQTAARCFLGYDQYLDEHKNNSNMTIQENRQGWHTNVNSWTDPNVQSTYRGLIVKYEKLCNDPPAVLADIVSHLSLSHKDLKLNYSYIDEFHKQNPIAKQKDTNSFNISNQTKKFLMRELNKLDILEEFQYSI